jgi:MFS family permease
MSRLSWPRLLALSAFSFAITLVTNSLDPAVVGHKVLQLAPDSPNTLLGFSTFAASLLAIFLGPVVGALSDRTRSRLGRRKPYFLAGVAVLVFALFTIALAPSITIFVIGILLYRLGDNLVFTPWQALYPDHVPAEQRGQGAGFKALLDILGVLVGRFAAGELVARQILAGDGALLSAISVPVIGAILSLALTFWAMRGLPEPEIQPQSTVQTPWGALKASFKFDSAAHPVFVWWFVNRALFWTGFVILGQFLLLFIIDVLSLPEADAQRYLARLSLVLGGAILLVAIPSGYLADRLGRKPLILIACGLATVGTLLVLLLRDLNALTFAGGLIGLGSGIFISSDFALLTDIVPSEEAGRYLGLSNIASAGGGAVARLLGGLLIDPINAATGSSAYGYLALYSLAALLFFLSLVAGFRLPNAVRSNR